VWHVRVNDETYIASTSAELMQWLEEYRVTGGTYVWRVGLSQWMPLDTQMETLYLESESGDRSRVAEQSERRSELVDEATGVTRPEGERVNMPPSDPSSREENMHQAPSADDRESEEQVDPDVHETVRSELVEPAVRDTTCAEAGSLHMLTFDASSRDENTQQAPSADDRPSQLLCAVRDYIELGKEPESRYVFDHETLEKQYGVARFCAELRRVLRDEGLHTAFTWLSLQPTVGLTNMKPLNALIWLYNIYFYPTELIVISGDYDFVVNGRRERVIGIRYSKENLVVVVALFRILGKAAVERRLEVKGLLDTVNSILSVASQHRVDERVFGAVREVFDYLGLAVNDEGGEL
jgi:hypothetical protein